MKTPFVALIHHLITRHKLPFKKVVTPNGQGGVEKLQKEDHKMTIRQVIDAIYPPEIRKHQIEKERRKT